MPGEIMACRAKNGSIQTVPTGIWEKRHVDFNMPKELRTLA